MFPSDDNLETSVTLETPSNSIVDEESFHILLLGDWSGQNHSDFFSDETFQNKLIEIDRDNFEEVLNSFKIKLDLNLKNDPSNSVTIDINEFNDFHPDNIFLQLPCFSHLRDVRKRLLNADTYNSAASEVRSWNDSESENKTNFDVSDQSSQVSDSSEGLLDRILNQEKDVETSPIVKRKKSELDVLIGNLVKPYIFKTDEVEQTKLIEIVDQVIGDLMREILGHPRFKEIESSWRGLHFLVRRVETDAHLKLFLYDTGKEKLSSDLKSVNNLSDSVFFQTLIDNANQLADKNWSVLCGNFDFNLDIDDSALLIRLAKISNTLDAPFISYLKPNSFKNPEFIDNFSESQEIIFDDVEAKLWESLRNLPEANYLGFALPRFLARFPYSNKIEPLETFIFDEFEKYSSSDDCNWMNPVFGCAFLLAQNYTFFGWSFKENLQLQIDDLPFFVYEKNDEIFIQKSLKIILNQKNAIKLMNLGFMTFISFKDSDFIRLTRFQSISSNNSILLGKWRDV